MKSRIDLFQVNLKNKTTGEVFALVQFYNGIDVVFPETILKTAVNGAGVIFSHKIEVVDSFGDRLIAGKSKAEIGTERRTSIMLYTFGISINKGSMNS